MNDWIPLTMASPNPRVSLFLTVLLLLTPKSFSLSINPSLNAGSAVENSLGINCRGSILCPDKIGSLPDYLGTLIEIANGSAVDCPSDFSCGPLNDADVYFPKDNILCLPTGQSLLGGICAFAQGSNVPATGVTGALVKRKLGELSNHGCRVCGSVPLSGDNDPRRQGILTVNYISKLACKGLCPSKHIMLSVANLSSLLTNSGLLLGS